MKIFKIILSILIILNLTTISLAEELDTLNSNTGRISIDIVNLDKGIEEQKIITKAKLVNKIENLKNKKKNRLSINKFEFEGGNLINEYNDLKVLNSELQTEFEISVRSKLKNSKSANIDTKGTNLEAVSLMTLQEFYIPNDSKMSDQWYIQRILETDGNYFKNANTRLRSKPIVAVIDAGVDFSHEDLAGVKWSSSVCVNEKSERIGSCDGGYDFVNNDKDVYPDDNSSHGNNVASLIAASTDNGLGLTSLSSGNVQIMSLRVADNGYLETENAVKAIYFAVNNGAKIINMSFAGPTYSNLFYDAIKYADEHGVIIVTAAGNYGLNLDIDKVYPASYDYKNIITVGAIDETGNMTSWSNYGKAVDVLAPGSRIAAASIVNSYNFVYGTSFSAPIFTSYLINKLESNKGLRQNSDKILSGLPKLQLFKGRTKDGSILAAGSAVSGVKASEQTDVKGYIYDKSKLKLSGVQINTLSAPILSSPGSSLAPGPTLSLTNSVNLSWNHVSGAATYGVYLRNVTTGQLILDCSQCTTNNFYTFNHNFVPGNQYRWNMYSFNAAGNYSAISSTYHFTVASAITYTPPASLYTGSTAAFGPTLTGSSVKLSWSAVTGITYYNINVTNITTGITNNFTAAGTNYNLGVVASNKYRWSVRSLMPSGFYTAYSTEYYFQMQSALNTTPSIPTVSGVGAGKALTPYNLSVLSRDLENEQIRYEVMWDQNNSNSTSLFGYYSSSLAANVSGTYNSPGTYCIKVRATDTNGNTSAYSNCHSVVISAAAAPLPTTPSLTFPTIFTQVNGTPFNISLTTANIPTGSTITLTPSMGNITPSSIITTGNTTNVSLTIKSASSLSLQAKYNNNLVGTSNSFTVNNGSTCNTVASLNEYTLANHGTVSSTTINKALAIEPSQSGKTSLQGLCTPANPSLPEPYLISPGTITSPGETVYGTTQTLSYTTAIGAARYEIYVRDVLTNILTTYQSTTNSVTITNLVAGKTYKWNAIAYDSSNRGGWSTDPKYFTIQSTTLVPDPTPPPGAASTITTDDFNRASNSIIGNSWIELGDANDNLKISNNALSMSWTNQGWGGYHSIAKTISKQNDIKISYKWKVTTKAGVDGYLPYIGVRSQSQNTPANSYGVGLYYFGQYDRIDIHILDNSLTPKATINNVIVSPKLNTNYNVEITINASNKIEVRIWESTLTRPLNPQASYAPTSLLSTGNNLILSASHGSANLYTLATEVDDLLVSTGESVAPTNPAGSFANISSQVTGTEFPITLNTTSIPSGSTITLTPSFGNVYPSTITTTGNLTTTNIKITSSSGQVSLQAKYNNSLLSTSNSFTLTSPSTCLQDFSLTGVCTPPSPITPNPTNLTPGTIASPGPTLSSISQTFTWSPVVGASKYAFYLRNVKTGALIVANENVTTNSYTYNYLDPLTNYKWNTVAFDSAGKGGWSSDAVHFTTGNFTAVNDPSLNGQVEIIVTDFLGTPVSNAQVTYECIDTNTNICPLVNGTKLSGSTFTDSYGKVTIKAGELGVIPNLQVKVFASEIYTKTSNIGKGIITTIKTQNYITKDVVLNATAIVISLAPGVGEAYDIYTLATGKDPITGETLDDLGKFFTVAGLASGVGSGKVARIAGDESLKAIAKTMGHNVDDVIQASSQLASEIPLSTVGEVKTFAGNAVSNIAEIMAEIPKRSNYRVNLLKYIGVVSEQAKGWDAHHVMPQKYVREFESFGIDISNSQYMVLWKQVTGDPNSHRKLAKTYNDEWKVWFDEFKLRGASPSKAEALSQAQKMFTKYESYYRSPAVKVDFTK